MSEAERRKEEQLRRFRERTRDEVNQYFGYRRQPNIETGSIGNITYRINHDLIAELRCILQVGLAQQYQTNPLVELLHWSAVQERRQASVARQPHPHPTIRIA